MRVEVLSDHGGQQLQLSAQQLRSAEDQLAARQGGYQQASHELQQARRSKGFWKRLFAVRTAEEQQALARTRGAWHQVIRADYGRQQIQHRVQQRAAGVRGEDALAWGLSELSDEWLMLRGYRNRKGEADHVLVGPMGVWAVEVKLRRVRLNAVGEQWWFEKLDRWGNVVETGWARDGGGRSWARQVNDIAGDLQAWLTRNHHQGPVHTAVMLMHERAQLGRCEKLTVDLIGTQPAHLLNAIAARPSPLAPDACQDIARLIRRDHQFHDSRRRRAK